MKIRVLTRTDVKRAVGMVEAISTVREAFVQLSLGQAVVPQRIPLALERGTALFMPAFLPRSGSLGIKLVSVFAGNQDLKLPTIHALVVLIDSVTGIPKAVMDGMYLTALRTGAASGVATDLFSRAESQVAAVFGAGRQGRSQIQAVCAVRNIRSVQVYDTNATAARDFVREMRNSGPPVPEEIRTAGGPGEALREADIVCTATTSLRPVFDDVDVSAGVHINAVGSYTPQMQEIPSLTVARSSVFVDSLSACLEEAGDLIIPIRSGEISKAHIRGEIGEVASGRKSGRRSPEEVTLFKSVGVAVQDAAVADRALTLAENLGLGTEIEI